MAQEAQATQNPAAESFLERHAALLWTLGVILATAVAFVVISPLRHSVSYAVHGNLSGLRDYIRRLHAGGAVLLFALILIHSVVPYLSEILTTTSGYVYGFLPGLALASFGWTCTAVLTFWLGRVIGKPVLRRVLGKRFVELDRAMDTGGVRLMLLARLIPIVPFSLLGYVAGATDEPLWRVVWTSFLGYLPLTAAVAYLGSQAKSLSASNPILWAVVVFVVALLIGSHLWTRRQRKAGKGLADLVASTPDQSQPVTSTAATDAGP
jgi:uncharacterized membrane protein YdjX (TVP38/TMEM64 family)